MAKYLSYEIEVTHCLLSFKGEGVIDLLTEFEALTHSSDAWRSEVHDLLVRTQEARTSTTRFGNE